jgi:FtsP/CotA-like multicopper oxidase with cupredoxin domain
MCRRLENENRALPCLLSVSRSMGWPPLRGAVLLLCMIAALANYAGARTTDPADQVCPRSAPGSVVPAPPDLWSQNGLLEVNFTFQTTVDEQGLTRYCYLTDTGLESPTLHVYPGDQLIIHFQNELPTPTASQMMNGMKMPVVPAADSQGTGGSDCPGSGVMTAETTNLHFHGTNVPPTCGQDEVIHTMIQPGDTFTYDVQIPQDEPPGLYWYHPHPLGFSEGQVQGGAAGALIVEGIQNVNTLIAGLPQRLLVVRDQLLPDSENDNANIPAWDISVNYVPIPFPIIPLQPFRHLPPSKNCGGCSTPPPIPF